MPATLPNKWAVATVSLGKHESHTLERKIQAAHINGFQGIELVHADLHTHSKQHKQPMITSAKQIRDFCDSLSVEILSLNPFKNFEGNLAEPLQSRLNNAKDWIELAAVLGAIYLQVPSQFLENSTGDEAVIIPELQTLADLAAQKNVKIAYEATAFARHNPLWQDSLRIVNSVGRPNFGLCLDSFHIHGRIWGDAYAESGVLQGGPQALEESMAEFLTTCPKDKVFYVQLSDASRFDPPLTQDFELFEGLEVRDPRLVWSRHMRPFPLEKPGYFPVLAIAKLWLQDFGWEGWVSLEGFLKETEEESNGPEVMGERARRSIRDLCSALSAKKT